jgi:hypothetical protein
MLGTMILGTRVRQPWWPTLDFVPSFSGASSAYVNLSQTRASFGLGSNFRGGRTMSGQESRGTQGQPQQPNQPRGWQYGPPRAVIFRRIVLPALAAVLAAGCSSAATPPPAPTPSIVPAATSSSATPSQSPTPTPTPAVAPATPPPAPVTPKPAPATQPQPATPSPAAPPPAASCTPLSNEGTCYEPGEFCRKDDHGASGVAGDGKQIVCEDNDGWRWEPV